MPQNGFRVTLFMFVVTFIGLPTVTSWADVSMPAIFSNHMVLQRDLAVPVWGWADSGETVTVEFAGQSKEATASDSGRWKLKLDPIAASSEGRVLTVKGSNEIKYNDVLVGDCYICSGQSNMEWAVKNSLNPKEEIAAADHPNIRLFDVPGHITSPVPLAQLQQKGTWKACSSDTVGGFSAVGYYFGRKLNKESGVPIGLIGTNWGGTRIEPWTAPVGFRSVPELKSISDEVSKFDISIDEGKQTWNEYLNGVEQWAAEARKAIAAGNPPGAPQSPPGMKNAGQPNAIYNAMVYPLIPYGIRGAIWYQGESNGGEGESYYQKKKALVHGWRELWDQGDFPIYFYWVQLADFKEPTDDPAGGDGWAKLREAQRKALEIPHTGMAVITDIGNAKDIHPRNKQDVGGRLANWALRDIYKKDVVPSGPLFREITTEGNKLRVHFEHVGDGLMVGKKNGLEPTAEDAGGELKRFAVAGEDKKWHWADAKIDGETVVVTCAEVEKPVAVRYGFSMNPAGANLYNREGMPASPFRSDNW